MCGSRVWAACSRRDAVHVTADGAEVLSASPSWQDVRVRLWSPARSRSFSTRRIPRPEIATITFNRPDRLNAPTIAARLRYADLLHRASIDDDVKVLVIRGAGDDLGSGADLPEFMAVQDSDDDGPRLAEFRHRAPTKSRYPPKGSLPARCHRQPVVRQPARRVSAACRTSRRSRILEVKGYCYGWHFYQAADADLVISSDDALFGHPSFRYAGWGPRMWWWAQTMGIRKFQEMVFTGRPFTAAEMYDCDFVNSVVPRDRARGRGAEVRARRARATGPPTPSSCRRRSSRS